MLSGKRLKWYVTAASVKLVNFIRTDKVYVANNMLLEFAGWILVVYFILQTYTGQQF